MMPFTKGFNILYAKKVVSHIFSHYYAKVDVDCYYSLPVEKTLTLHNILINIKSNKRIISLLL